MSAIIPPYMQRLPQVIRPPSQAAPNPFEVYRLEELQWNKWMSAEELRSVVEARRLIAPEHATKAALIRMLEEHDEAQPKSVMAALNR